MRALVLGSSGQIGAHLTEHLRNQGDEVVEWDLELGSEYDLRLPNNNLVREMMIADFTYFLAFDVGGSTYLKEYQDSYEFIENNTQIMMRTFGALETSRVPFIFASSQMATMSHSAYGVLKRAGEFYTKSLGDRGTVVRFWNVYGREHDPDKFHVITDFIKMAVDDGVIRCRTKGHEQRQFLHADDCSRALERLAVCNYPIQQFDSVDITSYQWVTVRKVAEIIQKYTDCAVEFSDEEDTVQGRKNEPDTKFKYHSGWKPEITFEVGIKGLIDEYTKS